MISDPGDIHGEFPHNEIEGFEFCKFALLMIPVNIQEKSIKYHEFITLNKQWKESDHTRQQSERKRQERSPSLSEFCRITRRLSRERYSSLK